ncbi:MAG: protoporphyrinogen oxidase [Acidimicrobiia bacterium]|nr:protoporphyrinogen oxidase [Acidimicrobiia bacterium]
MVDERIAVIGGGITGLAAARRLTIELGLDTVVFEADPRLGGRIDSSTFASVEHLDAAADAFLARVPDAVALAQAVGLGDDLVSPEPVGAAVWLDGLHPIPEGLMLGLPGEIAPLLKSGLLSWRGKARAGLEPLLPRTSTEPDSVGEFVRARFGDEVHERLVDSLVGSIYATDTDSFSLAEVPQLAALANGSRSVLLCARRSRARSGASPAGTATAAASPIFAAPRGGQRALIDATATAIRAAGGEIRTGTSVSTLERDKRWVVDGEHFDAVLFATPATATGRVLDAAGGSLGDEAAALLGQAETADVVMVTLHLDASRWPERLTGLSGYLVPKPVQKMVTAASFGSQKWAHWRPPGGGVILRVSLGRDGLPVLHLSDEEILETTLTEIAQHLGIEAVPLETRITRWPGAFAQYRPHHAAWVGAVERALPVGVYVGGASYRGIGIPACVRQGNEMAGRASKFLTTL